MLPFENTSRPSHPAKPSPTLDTDGHSTRVPWIVAPMSLGAWALWSGTAILLGLVVHPTVTWIRQQLSRWPSIRLDGEWSASSSSAHRLPLALTLPKDLQDLPFSSDKIRLYVLPEEDMLTLFHKVTPPPLGLGVDPDTALLELWEAATCFDLDELGDEFTLGEMVAAVPEVDPDVLHAIVFTFTEPEEASG